MGVYLKSSLQILVVDGQLCLLCEVIDVDKVVLFGDKVVVCFGELLFLFKVLCVVQLFLIQVYFNKQVLEEGFVCENVVGILFFVVECNYKDLNYKLELVFVLMLFLVMNVFCEFSEIVILLQLVVSVYLVIGVFLQQLDVIYLSQLFVSLLNMQGEEKVKVLQVLCDVLVCE